MVRVAKGEIIERSKTVHGKTLKLNEEKVLVTEHTKGELTHPDYGYPVEANGFCSWNQENVRKQ